jgi:translation initiation factor 2 subunit 2
MEKTPAKPGSGERFELPRLQLRIAGRRTVFFNFKEIAEALNREPQHVLKFLTKELATAASFDGTRVVFQGRVNYDRMDPLFKIYVSKFVMCPTCGRPDTKIVKEGRFLFLQCEACGARSSVLPG